MIQPDAALLSVALGIFFYRLDAVDTIQFSTSPVFPPEYCEISPQFHQHNHANRHIFSEKPYPPKTELLNLLLKACISHPFPRFRSKYLHPEKQIFERLPPNTS